MYMLRCSDGSLYTGAAKDLKRRVRDHQRGSGARYTRSRLPVELCYVEELEDWPQALRREWAIKRMSRREKERLLASQSVSVSSDPEGIVRAPRRQDD